MDKKQIFIKNIYYLFFILCLLSCNHVKKNVQEIGVNDHLYVIDMDKAEYEEKILLSEICSNMKTIILETNDDVLINDVGGVQVYKDYIFVLDDKKDANLFAFNKQGKFIRKYGSRGNGPGEYLSIKDFTIDPEKEIIFLADDYGDQILCYDMNTGKFISKISIDKGATNCLNIQYNNGKLYTDVNYYQPDENAVLLREIDMATGNIKNCWLEAKRYNMGWDGGVQIISKMEESFFYEKNQETCKYVNVFMDTIISIGKNGIAPYAVFKEKNWITTKGLTLIIEDTKDGILQAIRDRGFSFQISNYMEWNDYISFNYLKGKDLYFVLFNKKNGKIRTSKLLLNDLGYKNVGIVSSFVCSDENGLYEMIGMFSIDGFVQSIQQYDILKESLDKYEELMNLPEDTNPILFYYEFKKE